MTPEEHAAELLANFTEVHRGWCNYCKGNKIICEATELPYLCVVLSTRTAVTAALAEAEEKWSNAEDEVTRLIAQYDEQNVYIDKLNAALLNTCHVSRGCAAR